MATAGEISNTVNDPAGELGVEDSGILIEIIQKTNSVLRIENFFFVIANTPFLPEIITFYQGRITASTF